MADKTAIEWTDATVNFWWGCTKVGPGCDHCYAEALDGRFGGGHWGAGAQRRKIKSAVALIHRLDNLFSWWSALEVPVEWFSEAWSHIESCDRLELQLVTKRISAVKKRLDAIGRADWPKHAGLIITIVNQEEAERDIPRLLKFKAELGIPWVGLSCEPLLALIDLPMIDGIDWIIAGGESGPNARPTDADWFRSLRNQCAAAAVPFFMKQLSQADTKAFKGFASFPAELQIREFPRQMERAA